MSEPDPAATTPNPEEMQHQARLLESMRRRLQGLTVLVALMVLGLFLEVVAMFGYIVEFHGGEYLLVAATAAGTALLGFFLGLAVGWFVRLK